MKGRIATDAPPQKKKLPLLWRDPSPHVIHGSLGPAESISQTAPGKRYKVTHSAQQKWQPVAEVEGDQIHLSPRSPTLDGTRPSYGCRRVVLALKTMGALKLQEWTMTEWISPSRVEHLLYCLVAARS